ncbi:LysR substrate-binding domain-containing protein [soil metagenome]
MYVHEIARLGSYREAARFLQVSQAALSRPIRLLEAELDVVLFSRGGNGSRLTEAGRIFLDGLQDTRRLLVQARNAVDEVRLQELDQQPRGAVTLAIPPSFAMIHGTQLLAAVRKHLPKVRLRILEGAARQLEDWLRTGTADLGVVVLPVTSNLRCTRLFEDDFTLVGEHRPKAAARQRWTFAQIARLPMVLPLPPYGSRRLIDLAAARSGVEITPVVEVDSLHIVKQLLAGSGLYTLLSENVRQADPFFKALFHAPIADAPRRELALAHPAGMPASLAARALESLILEIVELPPTA